MGGRLEGRQGIEERTREMSERTGVYPGTFDPVTKGHVDIVVRATHLVDRLIVAVADNDGKAPLFPLAERVAMLEQEIGALSLNPGSRIEVTSFDTLLVDFARKVGAAVIVRGLRAVSDFEYEFQMAGMNAKLAPKLETVFLMASDRVQLISSRFVKEIARLGGDVSPFVSAPVRARLESRLGELQRVAAGGR
jgi:pantetheine-phosphate adenylyltransferase